MNRLAGLVLLALLTGCAGGGAWGPLYPPDAVEAPGAARYAYLLDPGAGDPARRAIAIETLARIEMAQAGLSDSTRIVIPVTSRPPAPEVAGAVARRLDPARSLALLRLIRAEGNGPFLVLSDRALATRAVTEAAPNCRSRPWLDTGPSRGTDILGLECDDRPAFAGLGGGWTPIDPVSAQAARIVVTDLGRLPSDRVAERIETALGARR